MEKLEDPFPAKRPPLRRALLLWMALLIVLSAFASATLVTRLLLVHSLVEPVTLMAVRYSISAMGTGFLGWLCRHGRSRVPFAVSTVWGGLLLAAQAILFGVAAQMASASIAGLCFFGCASLTASILGSYFRRRWSKYQLVGIALGAAGFITVLGPNGNINSGALLAVLGGFAWGGYILWSQSAMPSRWEDVFGVTSQAMAIGAAVVWLFAWVLEPHGLAGMHGSAWRLVVYIGLGPQTLGLAVLGWLATRLDPVQVGVSQFGAPVFVAVGGVVFLGEPSAGSLWLGLTLILVGMVLSSRNRDDRG